jgi:hypothetical protein
MNQRLARTLDRGNEPITDRYPIATMCKQPIQLTDRGPHWSDASWSAHWPATESVDPLSLGRPRESSNSYAR